MQYWDCEGCGTQAIAGSLDNCPSCGQLRSVPAEVAQPSASAASGDAVSAAPQAPEVEGWGEPGA